MNKITIAMIVAKPGHLRNGLQSLLRTIPQIKILAESNDPSILLKMDEILPELILVDGSIIDDRNWSVFTKIQTDWPGTKVIVLTENDQQGQLAREAGADFYLLKGFPATELVQLIETSLIHDAEDEINTSVIE
jgi:DNA-binding NarL/FixJ family response regulator